VAVGSTEHCAPQKADTEDEGGFSVCKIVWKDVPSSTAHQLIHHPKRLPHKFCSFACCCFPQGCSSRRWRRRLFAYNNKEKKMIAGIFREDTGTSFLSSIMEPIISFILFSLSPKQDERLKAHTTWVVLLAISREGSNQFSKAIYHLEAQDVL
jgi:hypothetical protein